MKKAIPIIAITAILLFCLIAEETTSHLPTTQEEIIKSYFRPEERSERKESSIHKLIQDATFAGVVRFQNQPSTTNRFAEVFVDECWTGETSNETKKILFSKYDYKFINWVVPTNIPVVVFANKINANINDDNEYFTHGFSLSDNVMFNNLVSSNNLFYFPGGDRAWFRTTRDNGLLYEFSTNTWMYLRKNPNTTNYFEMLILYNQVSLDESARIVHDRGNAMRWVCGELPLDFLMLKHQDPSMTNSMKNFISSELRDRGWTWDRTNSVWIAP